MVGNADVTESEARRLVRLATVTCDECSRRGIPLLARDVRSTFGNMTSPQRRQNRYGEGGRYPDSASTESDFRSALKELKRRIRCTKANYWTELVHSMDDESWGKPCKIILKKLSGLAVTAAMEPRAMRDIIIILSSDDPFRGR